MPSRLDQILDRLVEIQRTIPGIVRAYPLPPFDLAAADTPCFVNVPAASPGDVRFHAAGLQRVETVIHMDLVVGFAESAESLIALQRKATAFRDVVLETFARHVRLSRPADGVPDLDFIAHAFIESHGPMMIEDTGTSRSLIYRFTLRVVEKFAAGVAV
jgi:hypothetical protein